MDPLDALKRIASTATAGAEPAHDWLHVLRVSKLASELCEAEGADVNVAVPAALLHELHNFPKNHPDSAKSGEICAQRAGDEYAEEEIRQAAHALIRDTPGDTAGHLAH